MGPDEVLWRGVEGGGASVYWQSAQVCHRARQYAWVGASIVRGISKRMLFLWACRDRRWWRLTRDAFSIASEFIQLLEM